MRARYLGQFLDALPHSVAAVYMLDSQFVTDTPKFIAGCMVRAALRVFARGAQPSRRLHWQQ